MPNESGRLARRHPSHAKELHVNQDAARPIDTRLSKPEAIWRAIQELGYRTDVAEILEYVRKKYGMPADSAPQVPDSPPQATQPAEAPATKPGGQKKPRGRNSSE
jgi:hypothetical protein